ncbi:MAG: carbamoyl-phosphate synthase domain-containing protein, partial [Leuconostoc gelidum]
MKKRYIVLENGSVYEGESFGSDVDVMAELVFNTGMSGYQESITDLSYRGEMIV